MDENIVCRNCFYNGKDSSEDAPDKSKPFLCKEALFIENSPSLDIPERLCVANESGLLQYSKVLLEAEALGGRFPEGIREKEENLHT